VELGNEQRITEVGDVIEGYTVKRIGLDGILLVNGRDRFHVGVGPQDQVAPPGRGAPTGSDGMLLQQEG
jgi:hypothetical protein